MEKIRIAIVGVGNCASSLVQGFEYYRDKRPEDAIGLMHWEIGGFRPFDIKVVAAFDIDVRKVGKDVNEAIFELPNCTTVFCKDLPKAKVSVQMGRISRRRRRAYGAVPRRPHLSTLGFARSDP